MPDLSIIIISYNTQAITLNCVKSIVKSINNISCEVIVIDNASEDKTIEKLEKLKNTNQNSKILINIVKNTEILVMEKQIIKVLNLRKAIIFYY